MRTFPYFQKLFCQPIVLLEEVRDALERDLIRVVTGGRESFDASIATNTAQMKGDHPTTLMGVEIGKPAKADGEWLQVMKVSEATRKAWRVEQLYKVYDSVAVVQINGVIDKHLSDFDLSCYGGCDLADVDRALMLAQNDSRVERVVLAINSPGGSAAGVPETAMRIREIRKDKEVHAFVDVMACSAAQWIAAQADITAVTQSTRLGSVGVYLAVLDATKAYKMAGYKVELIRAGKWKAMGSPFKPLTDEERAKLQAHVTELHEQFRAEVRAGRGREIADDAMEGQVHVASEAIKLGFADVMTNANLDEYVAGLLS